MVKAVKNQTVCLFAALQHTVDCDLHHKVIDNYYKPDLTKSTLARLSVVHRSLKVAKSGVKKRNRQALKGKK